MEPRRIYNHRSTHYQPHRSAASDPGYRSLRAFLLVKRQGAMDHLRKSRPHETHARERSRDRRERSHVPHSTRPISCSELAKVKLGIAIAQSKASGNFEARVGRAEDLSQFSDESFDVVYLNSVFHWVEDKPRALAEIFHILRPGGRLGLNCQDAARPHELRLFIRQALVEAGLELDHHIAQASFGLAKNELEAMV